jgi:hypothetical protein
MVLLPLLFTTVISPLRYEDPRILAHQPGTEYEAKLQKALHASNVTIEAHKQVNTRMQAQTVLQLIYLNGMQGQLQAQEEKKVKKQKTEKINMDGCTKILTQDNIIEDVKEWQNG